MVVNIKVTSPLEETVLPRLRGVKSYAKGYIANCAGPVHKGGDRNKSLMLWEDETDGHAGMKCFAGCTRKDIVEAIGLTEQDLYKPDGTHKRQARPTINTCDLMVDKCIRPDLLDSYGVHDGETTFYKKDGTPYKKKGVVIPYYTMDGKPYERYRLRTAIKAKDGTAWNGWDEKTQGPAPQLIPYGLHRLEQARKQGYLVIVEGESDCWTLWQWQFPALGLPGATQEKTVQLEHLQGIDRIYVIQEPDGAGHLLPDRMYKHLQEIGYKGKVYALNLDERTQCKDPNDLQKKDFKAFKATFEDARQNARPMFPVVTMPPIMRLCDLQKEVLPETRWAIPDILPEGLTLLAGKPKLGKSWLLLAMMLGIAKGSIVLGSLPVEAGEVLYVSLEDNKKRLQKRSNTILAQAEASPNFYVTTQWNRLNEGGIEQLEEWLLTHPQTRVIGIDTWARIKPKMQGHGKQQYDEDYDALTPLQHLAAQHRVSIVLVHHMRKQESDDPIEMVNGSSAMAGAVDGFLLLFRKRGETDARLFVEGRDIEDPQELLLSFNQECATWTLKGDASVLAGTAEQQAILDAMREYGKPIALKDLANRLEKNVNTTRNLIVKLRNADKILLQDNLYSVVTVVTRSRDGNYSNPVVTPTVESTIEPYYAPSEVTTPYYGTPSTVVTPLRLPVERNQEAKNSEVTTVTTQTTDTSLLQRGDNIIREAAQRLYTQILQVDALRNEREIKWNVPGSRLSPGFVPFTTYAHRLKKCIDSSEVTIVDAAVDEMRSKLSRWEVQA